MHALNRLFFVLAAIVALVGCGDNPRPEKPGASYTTTPFPIPAGQDVTFCEFVRATNEGPVDVAAMITDQDAGGHHVVVYAVDHPVDLPPGPCTQGGQPTWDMLLVSQKQHEELRFQDGVGYRFDAHQQMVIETHYINASDLDVNASSKLTLEYAAEGTVKDRVGTYFFGTFNVDIDPNASASAISACSPPETLTLRTMLGHQHRMGTHLGARLIPGNGAPPLPLYESDNWEAAPLESWPSGIALGASDKLEVSCSWSNTSGEPLSYPREMCFAIGYYWPSAGASYTCASGGGTDACQCFTRGTNKAGPGGGSVTINLGRAAAIPGAAADPALPHTVYCYLWNPNDLGVPNKAPRYFNDAQGVKVPIAADAATIGLADVSPGTYSAVCMLDLVNGGFILGPGDVINGQPVTITVGVDEHVTASVILDYAIQ